MEILVVSDIHSNLTALNRVLDDSGEFDAAICAGDVVGYGPDPAECVDVVSRMGMRCVSGNHDHAVATRETDWFNPAAQEAIRNNRRLLGKRDRAWLGNLPLHLNLDLGGRRVVVYHGSPRDPLYHYVYPLEAEMRADSYLRATGADILILGHTHIPYTIQRDAGVVLNPGSVGQPRDGDPRSSYVLLDLDSMGVDHRRVGYDIDEVASRIRGRGLPEVFASRLFRGL